MDKEYDSFSLHQQYKIPISEMKWYAAFHNTGHHPHIHLVVYSENIKHGYLTKKGIDSLHSISVSFAFVALWFVRTISAILALVKLFGSSVAIFYDWCAFKMV